MKKNGNWIPREDVGTSLAMECAYMLEHNDDAAMFLRRHLTNTELKVMYYTFFWGTTYAYTANMIRLSRSRVGQIRDRILLRFAYLLRNSEEW